MTATVKACYKITNWRTYNGSLVQRGDITIWFDEDVIDAWEHDNDEPKVEISSIVVDGDFCQAATSWDLTLSVN